DQEQRRADQQRHLQRVAEERDGLVGSHKRLSAKTPHQGTNQQVPSIDHDEQKNLERGGDDDRGQLHHADRGGNSGGYQIDDEKREKEGSANTKPCLQFAQQVRRRDDAQAEIIRAGGTRLMRQFDEEREIFFPGVLEHEVAHRNDGALKS